MAHLLILDLPGGNDGDILEAARAAGHRFTLLTADAGHYAAQPALAPLLAQGCVAQVAGFALEDVLAWARGAHASDPFEAVLCLQDLRLVEAAHVAAALGLRHLNPQTAALCRDKGAVRARLDAAGMPQPASVVVHDAQGLMAAVARLGLPLIIKPVDGFGSQHVFALRDERDLMILGDLAPAVAQGVGEYGLGVMATGALLVERLLEGPVIGCDTMSAGGQHRLLGVNEKLFFPPPSFAIRGGCFATSIGQFADLEAHVFALLDAVGFDHGAAHVELALTPDGPRLIELNPRLVGARIGRLISAARQNSVHAELIDLHLYGALPAPAMAARYAVTRWLAAPSEGVLDHVTLPKVTDPALVGVTMVATVGAHVSPPLDNADRLGCVIACDADRAIAEKLAEAVVAASEIIVLPRAFPRQVEAPDGQENASNRSSPG